MPQLFFLKAPVPLTKSYERGADNKISKTSYPHVFNVTSITENCADLKAFYQLLVKYAAQGCCLLKGKLNRVLKNESRKGSTTTMDETEWVVLDIDGLPINTSVDNLLDEIGLPGISYIVQYSASYKVENDHLRCHLFFLLDKPYAAPTIKQWLISLNLNVPVLASALRLTRTGNTLHWPLDISTCQNDKLIYIAAPTFKGMKDPMPKGRIQYVRKQRSKLSLTGYVPNTAVNKEQTTKKIDALRAEAGLPKRKETYKTVGDVEYMSKPDAAIATGIKNERGFTYFNLNGGDSWAYYHPDESPEFIYNFKNEPTYLTKELLPEYWKEVTEKFKEEKENLAATSHQGAQTTTSGLIRLAFWDRKSSAYFCGEYDPANDILELDQVKNESQIRHYAEQYGMPLGSYIPRWSYIFDPSSSVRVDVTNKILNTFQPSVYMRATPKKVTSPPKTILRIIHHALGSDQRCTDHFLNWLAFILQYKTRTRTAWILHGVQGTGKGLLMNRILRPLLGHSQTTTRRMKELNERYTHFLQNMLLVSIDEVEAKAFNNDRGVMADLKNFITEPTVTIRRMYANTYETDNYSNLLFASNRADPVTLDREDRRFNVGTYQEVSLIAKHPEFKDEAKINDLLDKELQPFHDYLAGYKVDKTKAHTFLDTEDRQNLISISENSLDTTANAILEGNFEFFMDQLPTSDRIQAADRMNQIADYKATLIAIIDRTQKNSRCAIARDELRTLFDYNVGNMPVSPNKFTSLLKHHRIRVSKVWIDKTVTGFYTTWKDAKQFPTYRSILLPQQPKIKRVA